jgi:hypothetical protein
MARVCEKNTCPRRIAAHGATARRTEPLRADARPPAPLDGALFVCGRAADRLAVRNTGAIAVVEGPDLQACKYMTRGMVLILGDTSENVGAGMTGRQLFLRGPGRSPAPGVGLRPSPRCFGS